MENKLSQIKKLSFSLFIFFAVVGISMLLLQIPYISNLFSVKNVSSKHGFWLWVLVWIFIVLEAGVIPGPYLPFVVFFSQTAMAQNRFLFLIYTTSAVFIGRIIAWFIGRNFGGRLLKWTAQQDFDKWSKKLAGPGAKWFYAFTVVAPFFPDFVLSWVAGAVGINFWFYIIVNVLSKGVENALIIYLSYLVGGNFSWMYIFLFISFISFIIYYIINIVIENKFPKFNGKQNIKNYINKKIV